MTEKEILISQTANAYDWTNKLIETIPLRKMGNHSGDG